MEALGAKFPKYEILTICEGGNKSNSPTWLIFELEMRMKKSSTHANFLSQSLPEFSIAWQTDIAKST